MSKSIAWIFSGNLYPAASRWAKRLVTLLRDGMGCEDWAILVSRSSLNSANAPEILGAVYSSWKALISPIVVVSVMNLFFGESERQSLMDPRMVEFALVHAM